jgi:hypothetical protein
MSQSAFEEPVRLAVVAVAGCFQRLIKTDTVNSYFRMLSETVHSLTGLVAVVDSWDDIIDTAANAQVLAQLDQEQADSWRAAGWLA